LTEHLPQIIVDYEWLFFILLQTAHLHKSVSVRHDE